MNTIAAIAVMLHEDAQPEFKIYAQQVLKNAQSLAHGLMDQGIKLVTNGTENHMMVIDCEVSFGLGGSEVEKVLDEVGITTNKSPIPDDPKPPFKPSGLRLGTPAMTTRGLMESDLRQISEWIVNAVKGREDKAKLEEIKSQVTEMALKFPVPGIE